MTTEHLFTTVDPLRLQGASCRTCTTTTFPVQDDCPRCTTTSMVPVELPARGTLWTWTVQTFAPKPPYAAREDFEPFCLGYVDLGPVIVESVLDCDPDALTVGIPLTVVPATWHDAEGGTVRGFAFSTAEEDTHGDS